MRTIRQITNLTEIHDHTFVNFLPKMGSEDLDKRYLERGNLAVHENTRQIQLHLET